jgi:hypothetical protein
VSTLHSSFVKWVLFLCEVRGIEIGGFSLVYEDGTILLWPAQITYLKFGMVGLAGPQRCGFNAGARGECSRESVCIGERHRDALLGIHSKDCENIAILGRNSDIIECCCL